ncbi:A/G-specific adenine glycosylase [Vibrio parahaemolyticus]|uniref:A/G-specific adenine glycosylase n=1 Tax=Vibrio TaxID=662 RepID=UPI000CE9799A|nr:MULTISPECIES: A/G-specific adenine glycosylase [Vibrio]EGR2699845.1 A/G-specific adenine glycosylase [Vibrio parahaemolyticus]MDW2295202.1 A/G-specific adenine glycosylase [Vibrio sp. 1404]AVF75465.1 A/G-specific adenine glycosylase [Vibrio alginolyticus]AVF75491.1 A/G-specific adenine glycosylase [Vibrio alginolyticus]ELA8113928.1 A/G-specific adenine glycosylase [Vibrio parahaemolyticus]
MATKSLTPKQFQEHLLTWQRQHGRHDLPWQQNPSPYRVLVSEVMLQQTQVVTVIPYFERWMASFPTIEALANATEDEVMNHWQGLGYYSRARNLRKAAIYIHETWADEFPSDVTTLQEIPGVGRYTAGAIASFAFNTYGPIVDGNVKRLFCRYFGIEGVPGTSAVDKQLWSTAEAYTPIINNRQYAQGLLDMGATLCKPKSPDCGACSFTTTCIAYQTNRVSELPTPKPKKIIPTKPGHFLWIESNGKLLLEKRADDGIWGALWCLPQIYIEPEQLGDHVKLQGSFKHTFSHYKLDGKVWFINKLGVENAQQQWIPFNNLSDLGLPKPIRTFIEKHLKKAALK